MIIKILCAELNINLELKNNNGPNIPDQNVRKTLWLEANIEVLQTLIFSPNFHLYNISN